MCTARRALLADICPVSEEKYGFFRMGHEFISEAWLIFDQESNGIIPGNVLCRHDGEFVPRNPVAESDSENFPHVQPKFAR